MMQQAQQSTQQTAQIVQSAATKIEGISNSLKGFARSAVGALAGFGLASSLKGAFDKFAQYENQMIELRAEITATGGDVDKSIAQYEAYAQRVSQQTLLTKQQTLALINQAQAMGFTGHEAENLVTTTIALSKGNAEQAAGFVRIASIIQRGNPEIARRVLGLSGIKDKTELLNKINERLGIGLAVAEAKTTSINGQITKLTQTFGELSREVGQVVADAIQPFVNFLTRLKEQFDALDPSIKKTVAQIIALTLAVPAALLVLAALKTILTFMIAPIVSLTANIVVFTVSLAVSVAKIAIWTAAVVIAKTVTILWSAALIVFNAVVALQVGALIGLVVAVYALVAAFSVINPAVKAAYHTITELFGVLSGTGDLAAPILAIGNLFTGWWTTLSQVYQVAQVNLPAAWNLLQAQVEVTVSRIRDLWPPLWELISSAATLTWNYITDYAKSQFQTALQGMTTWTLTAFTFIKDTAINILRQIFPTIAAVIDAYQAIKGISSEEAEKAKISLQEIPKAGADAITEKYKEDLNKLLNTFQGSLKDSDATKKALENLTEARFAADQALWDEADNQAKANGEKLGADGVKSAAKGAHEAMSKLQSSAFGSVAMIAELQAQLADLAPNRLGEGRPTKDPTQVGKIGIGGADLLEQVAGQDSFNLREGTDKELEKDQLEALRELVRQGEKQASQTFLQLIPAGIGG
jgi:hypothetical protein